MTIPSPLTLSDALFSCIQTLTDCHRCNFDNAGGGKKVRAKIICHDNFGETFRRSKLSRQTRVLDKRSYESCVNARLDCLSYLKSSLGQFCVKVFPASGNSACRL